MKRFNRVVIPAMLMVILAASAACAQTYTGSLSSYDGGLLGTGAWIDSMLLPEQERSQWTPAVLSWEVKKIDNDFWRYTYTLNVYKYEISHMTVEVSETFTAEHLLEPVGNFHSTAVGMNTTGLGSPGMPEDFRGIKFDETWGTELTVTFTTVREPVWGDLYAKDGTTSGVWNTVWNAGFTKDDFDPLAPPQNEHLDYHLLVPDTNGDIIPEPASFLAPGAGMLGILFRRWRLRARKQ